MSKRNDLLEKIKFIQKEFDYDCQDIIDEIDELFDEVEEKEEEIESLEEQVSELEEKNPIEFDNNTHNNIRTQSVLENLLRNIDYIPVDELEKFTDRYNKV